MIKPVKGPLNEEELRGIVKLYGSFDPQYASLDYVKTLFNGNPFGFSWHVFAETGARQKVGHFAIIPQKAVINGQKALVGKGEAFFIDKKYRTAFALCNGRKMAVGLAIPLKLKEFAGEGGCKILFSINPQEVGMIHKMCGYRECRVDFERYYFFLRPLTTSSVPINLLSRAAALVQNMLLEAYSRINLEFSDGAARGRLCGEEDDSCRGFNGEWSLVRDAETMRWYLNTGRLEIAEDPDNKDDFTIFYSQKDFLEIVYFNVRKSPVRHMAALLREAKRRGVRQVIFNSYTKNNNLFSKSWFFAFVKRRKSCTIYLHAQEGDNLPKCRFTPFFYAIY